VEQILVEEREHLREDLQRREEFNKGCRRERSAPIMKIICSK
jgi:hypothetical protein